jgi:hypothetical protein
VGVKGFSQMDDIVEAALRKWPHVPHCYGWLALDARGDWYMRDERAQAAGPFPRVKGSRIRHEKLLGFIARNYAADAQGAWYFQNGPQRVYVELEAAPWIWRVQAAADGGVPAITSHTGRAARAHGAWADGEGRLYLDSDLGLGLVHSLDMEAASDALDAGRWPLAELAFDELPARFGFVRRP